MTVHKSCNNDYSSFEESSKQDIAKYCSYATLG